MELDDASRLYNMAKRRGRSESVRETRPGLHNQPSWYYSRQLRSYYEYHVRVGQEEMGNSDEKYGDQSSLARQL